MAKKPNDPYCLWAVKHYTSVMHWTVFPAKGKKSYKSKRFSKDGINWGATSDPEQAEKDFRQFPDAGVGLPTGDLNPFFVVETDTLAAHGVDGEAALKALIERYGEIPRTLMARSPSGSVHYYFIVPSGVHIKNSSSELGPGIDVRGHGGMVIAPPTQRDDGQYEWLNSDDIAEAPAWLLELVCAHDDTPAVHNVYTDYNALPLPSTAEIRAMLAVIPNEEHDWHHWCRIAMAIWDGTKGSVEGLELFDEWSRKWTVHTSKSYYSRNKVVQKWNELRSSPPRDVTVGTLFHFADEADATWHDAFNEPESESSAEPEEPINGESSSAAPKGDITPTKFTPPLDLWDKFPPPPLPKGLLPKVIERYAFEQGRQMGADPVGLAMGALVSCAAAIPDSIQIQPKRHDHGWKESTRLWVALIGGVSAMKSPIMKEVTRPINTIDRELSRQYAQALAAYKQLPKEDRDVTPEPLKVRLKIEDITPEAAQNIMADSPNGVMMVRDELSGWFGSMEKYGGSVGSSADRGYWLSAYNGGRYTFDRVKRESRVIENLSVNLLGGIQPSMMVEFANAGSDDGLIQRLIPIILRDSVHGRDTPMAQEVDDYNTLVEALYALNNQRIWPTVEFEDEALRVRDQCETEAMRFMRLEMMNAKMAAHFGKYHGLFVRLCLLWHMIEHHKGRFPVSTIDAATAQRVYDFMFDFLRPHAFSFYMGTLGMSEDHERLLAVAGYILAKHLETISNRDVQMGTRKMRDLGRRKIEDLFYQLFACGWLLPLKAKRATDPPHWQVNPQVHLLFAERAIKEAESREEVRIMLQARFNPSNTANTPKFKQQ